jgi:hypothetical protein
MGISWQIRRMCSNARAVDRSRGEWNPSSGRAGCLRKKVEVIFLAVDGGRENLVVLDDFGLEVLKVLKETAASFAVQAACGQ